MKLFTIGDSISQGFMSGAGARTDLSFSTLIAEQLKAKNYQFPIWEKGGQPLNIEYLLRKLEKRLGSNIKGPIEWPIALSIINNYFDEVEDYYEREEGNKPVSKIPYHNVAVRGFDISSSWQITPNLSEKFIDKSKGKEDNTFGLVDESVLRTAYTVLANKTEENNSQLDWLNYHHKKEGVENLILWLGGNNALGTVLNLKINQTSSNGTAFENGPEKVSFQDRRNADWNLWHPEDFRVEYKYMIDKVIDIMENNPNNTDYKIFIGTIPLVTIIPIIKAVGEGNDREDLIVIDWPIDPNNPAPIGLNDLAKSKEREISYAKYYTYFAFADNFNINDRHLNLQQVLHIDNCIRKYNRIIQEIIAEANERLGLKRFYIVDVATVLSDMAIKRNNYEPTYHFPEYFNYVYPRVDTKYYGTTRKGEIKSGGIFSLDGVHPTAIGQGIIAFEFLKTMKLAGSYTGDPEKDLNWDQIFKSDDLYSKPMAILSELYDNTELIKWFMKIIELIKPSKNTGGL